MKKLAMVLCTVSALSSPVARALTPPVVLVHGAHFSGKSWSLVQKDLARMGITAYAPDLYTAREQPTLRQAATRLCEALKSLKQQTVLVGHSQGGAIVTEAAALCVRQVRAIIYVSALIPQPGDGIFDALTGDDYRNYGLCAALDEKTKTYRLKGEPECRRVFMQDLLGFQSGPYYSMMVPEPVGLGASRAEYSTTAIASLPKSYIFTQDDLILSKTTQYKIVQKARITRQLTIQSSHTPFFKAHSQLAGMIAQLL